MKTEKKKVNDILYSAMKVIFELEKTRQKTFGVNTHEIYLLEYILQNGRQTITSIKNFLNLPFFNVSRITDRLAEKGLVKKTRLEENRKFVSVEITPEGEKLLDEIKKFHYSIIESEEDSLTYSDIEKISEFLKKIEILLSKFQ